MAHGFSGSVVIDRPIDEVFAFLADGTNDPKFSPRVQEMRKAADGPVAVGTVFESKVKDAGMTTSRKFELTAVEAPTKSSSWAWPRGRPSRTRLRSHSASRWRSRAPERPAADPGA
jgi:hypothetical protein